MFLENKNNIRFLDALRGLLCLIVLSDNCVNSFRPSIRFTNLPGTVGFIKEIVALSPLNIVYSGIPSVCLFFILSGFVLSYKFNVTGNIDIIKKAAVKRYLRLTIPIIGSGVLLFLCSWLFWKPIDIQTLLYQSVYGAQFTREPMINHILWTMDFELLGSFLVFALTAIFGDQKYRLSIYVVVLLFLMNTYYCLFVFGLIMSDLYSNKAFEAVEFRKLTVFLVFIVGLIFVSYPVQRPGVQLGGIYEYITFTGDWNLNYLSCVKFGSILLFVCFFYSETIIKLLSLKIPLFLGRISFPIYLVHPIVIMSLMGVFPKASGLHDYVALTIATFVISIIVAVLFEIYIDRPAIALSNKFANLIIQKR